MVAAMVIVMVPVGALSAFAAAVISTGTVFNGGTSMSVVRGVGSLQSQAVCDITIKEDSIDQEAWPVVDTQVNIVTPYGVTFAGKPTIKVNGTNVMVTMLANNSVSFDVSGDNDQRDQIVVSNIKLYVGAIAAGASELRLAINDPGDASVLGDVPVAEIKDGLIAMAVNKNTPVDVGKDNQAVSKITLTESAASTLDPENTFSIICPDGAIFYESPRITVSTSNGTSFELKSDYASLSLDRKTATWTVQTVDNEHIDSMAIDTCSINLDPTIALGTDIKLAFTTHNNDYPIAPSSVKVAEAVSDKTMPIISNLTPEDTSKVNFSRPAIGADYTDYLSGIDESSVKVTFDGADKTSKCTITDSLFVLEPSSNLSTGAHTVKLEVKNKAGNTASKTWTFTVTKPLLSATKAKAYWAPVLDVVTAYDAYKKGYLSVDYSVKNTGDGTANDVRIQNIKATTSSGTITVLSSQPVSIGTLAPGESKIATIIFKLPSATTKYGTSFTITCDQY
jgi:hypothetical protein